MGYCDYPKPPAGGETALLNERGPCTGRKPGCLLHNGHSGEEHLICGCVLSSDKALLSESRVCGFRMLSKRIV